MRLCMKICGIFDEEEFEITEEVRGDQERLRIYLFIKDLVSCRYLTTCFYFNTRKRKWKDFTKISTERFALTNCSSVSHAGDRVIHGPSNLSGAF